MYAQANQPFPNRIQLVLGSFNGPLVQLGPLGQFNPQRDLQVYVDGVRQTVQSSTYDTVNNRYLLFMASAIHLQGVIQVIYHVPSPPFVSTSTTTSGWGDLWGVFWGGGIGTASQLGGFALIASYSTTGP
jgi:hypothetical protein